MNKARKRKKCRRSMELQSHIHILRGLISYHERMFAPIKFNSLECQKDNCAAVNFADDVYLAAIKESLRLMKRELGGLK